MHDISVPEDVDLDKWLHMRPRKISAEDWTRYQNHISEIFTALGMDMELPGTRTTPARFLKAMFDATDGYEGDEKLVTAFPTECRGDSDCELGQVIEGPISFFALCEHHAMPFYGWAHIGYIPHEHILGLSKLTRLVRLYARRFTMQERIGQEIADLLVAVAEPHGVAVRLEASHLCTRMRGVQEAQSQTVTTNWRGNYEKIEALRREFLDVTHA